MPTEEPIRGGRVNWRPFHPAVVQGFEIRRFTHVGTTEGGGKWHVVRDTERAE